MKFYLRIFGAVLLTTFLSSTAVSSPLAETYISHARASSFEDDSYRLPESIKPDYYVIKLTPYITDEVKDKQWTFEGSVDIGATVVKETDRIVLHANDIDVHSVTVKIENDIINVDVTAEDERHFLIITNNSTFNKSSKIVITIAYTGHMKDDMHGFYRSYYYQNGTKRWLGVTQFEPTHARRAFPCFDEPSFKATFDISIFVEDGFEAISNMPQKSEPSFKESEDPKRTPFEFETTIPMSTYLVAFVVSDFSSVTSTENEKMKVWSRSEAINDAKFSKEQSPKILKKLEEFLNISYTLPKMDQVALPDFSAGAMENWGLLTYRERLLLFNDKATDTFSKQRIMTTIAHEMAHQWFGNLVSPNWWSEAWLNEGFATYFEYFITNELQKDWRLDEQFVVRALQKALAADSSESSHPMTHPVSTPDEIQGRFDTISYQKAGAVIRMLEHVLSPAAFKAGLQKYLSNKNLGVATPDDLFVALNDSYNIDDIDLVELMQQWTTQPGYPVVTVNYDIENATITLQQERFLLKKASAKDETWTIPISYACLNKGYSFEDTIPPNFFMTEEEHTLSFNTSFLCLFNFKQSGYYRVNYDAHLWDEITDLLKQAHSLIPPLSRAQLLDDSFALAQAEVIDYFIPLDISTYLEDENDYIPWFSALNSLSFLNTRFQGRENYTTFTDYVFKLLNNMYNGTEFEKIPNNHIEELSQSLVLTWMCKLEHEQCVNESLKMFSKVKNEAEAPAIPVNLQSVIYCTTVRNGEQSDWDFLWELYNNSNVATEKTVILSALGCANKQTLIDQLLETAITNHDQIRMQDVESIFSAVYSSQGGVDLALDFVFRKYKEIVEYYKKFNGDAASLVHGIASWIATDTQFTKFKELHKKLGATDNDTFTAAEKTIKDNLQWTEKHGQKIMEQIQNILDPPITPLPTTTVTTTTEGAGSISPAFYLIVFLSASYLYVYLQ